MTPATWLPNTTRWKIVFFAIFGIGAFGLYTESDWLVLFWIALPFLSPRLLGILLG
ncbi:membrane protein of unknown function [Magnetospira sp. QH-2]|nr:membrane protein of unknown function [Magnetospira sp. QH-2]